MKTFSNRYIYIYSTILIVIVALVLAFVSQSLKPMQQNNIKAENMQMILSCAGIKVDRQVAEDSYNKYIIAEYTVNNKGEIIDKYENQKLSQGSDRPFELSVKKQFKMLNSLDSNSAKLPIFVCKTDKGDTIYILSVRGAGLWGDIWGNIALQSDLKTIQGVIFDHESETPGLGAKIKDDPMFAKSFERKTIFEDDGIDFTGIKVEKRADKNDIHKVDALSGATLTSNGVSDMIQKGLNFYLPFLNNLKK